MFSSVEWDSSNYPDKLVVSMKNFSTVFSAWDGDELVGLVCAMDDGIMNAYIRYLIVKPEYQLKGIGKNLIDRIKTHYKDYVYIIVISQDKNIQFFEYCDFEGIFSNSSLVINNMK